MTKHCVTETCEICGCQSQDDPTVLILYKNKIYRCEVCRCKAKYGRYISDKELLEMNSSELIVQDDWLDYLEWLE